MPTGPLGIIDHRMSTRRAARNVLLIKILFVGVFAVCCAGVWWYTLSIARPRAACLSQPGAQWMPRTRTCTVPPGASCEAGGGWWEPTTKTCARVVSVQSFTGRK